MCEKRLTKIQKLNDQFRKGKKFGFALLVTEGVAKLGKQCVSEILDQIENNDAFDHRSDQNIEHRAGKVSNRGVGIRWHILYLRKPLLAGNPSDPANQFANRQLVVELESE